MQRRPRPFRPTWSAIRSCRFTPAPFATTARSDGLDRRIRADGNALAQWISLTNGVIRHGGSPRYDGVRPAPSREGASAGHGGAAQARLDPRQGAGLKRLRRNSPDRARPRSPHRVRRSRLPEHRRMLGGAARHHDDHGGCVHARMRLLQRQNGAASPVGSHRALPPCRCRCQARSCPRGGYLGRSRRPHRWRRHAFCPGDPGRSRRAIPRSRSRS